ncbi:MAG: DUF402 domain-containing protein [Anaerolineaceae bacterium]|nr:DUF402 domain-containing protein [Anaerolineaceae bacterium]MDE0327970.1 DUF402 domain-containing protein [Anaerolineaceae bacterium]
MNDVVVRKLDHEGREVFRYEGQVLQRGDRFVCLRAVFQFDDVDTGGVTFKRGDVFTEWFYSDRWYNVFRIEDGARGALKGWYCNITRPACIGDGVVSADDLALDLFVAPDGATQLLDEDEFALLDLPAADEAAALRAVVELRAAVAAGSAPFDDLRAVRRA